MHLSIYRGKHRDFFDGKDILMDDYLLKAIDKEIRLRDDYYIDNVLCFFKSLWRLAIREYNKLDDEGKNITAWKKKILREIDEYIFNHISKKIALKEIAGYVNLSPSYLSTFFKNNKGINLFQYIHVLKIEHAKELLTVDKKSIKEIAYLLGYSDPFYFTRVFKKLEGIGPSQYRERVISY
ncbi:MAG: helix-turn-helix transcriptional regulator [Clostridiaceae bacterium]|nr:helix-turn-helix transcriptional regulator [Clostridiaceae bacterium]